MVNMPSVPTILRPVAGIKFEIGSFCASNFNMSQFKHVCYLCSIVNKILTHVIFKIFIVLILFKCFKCPKISGILVVNNSIQFQFIFIALFMIQIIAKQLYRKLSFVVNLVLLKCRKLRREDQETSDWIVSRILY